MKKEKIRKRKKKRTWKKEEEKNKKKDEAKRVGKDEKVEGRTESGLFVFFFFNLKPSFLFILQFRGCVPIVWSFMVRRRRHPKTSPISPDSHRKP